MFALPRWVSMKLSIPGLSLDQVKQCWSPNYSECAPSQWIDIAFCLTWSQLRTSVDFRCTGSLAQRERVVWCGPTQWVDVTTVTTEEGVSRCSNMLGVIKVMMEHMWCEFIQQRCVKVRDNCWSVTSYKMCHSDGGQIIVRRLVISWSVVTLSDRSDLLISRSIIVVSVPQRLGVSIKYNLLFQNQTK